MSTNARTKPSIKIFGPPHYDLRTTVLSSPLSELPPLRFDAEGRRLHLVLQAGIEVEVHQSAPEAPLQVRGLPGGRERAPFIDALRALLRLDEDLALLYALTDSDPELDWAREQGAGRLLRSASAFEDLIKCLLLARLPLPRAQEVVARICQRLGPSFPSATVLLRAAPAQLRPILPDPLYQALLRLLRRCSDGSFYPETLRRGLLEVPEELTHKVFDEIMLQELEWEERLAGLLTRLVGPRAMLLMLPLCGCYDTVPLTKEVSAGWFARRARKRALRGRRLPPPRTAPERDRLKRAMIRRVGGYAHFRGLALRLLVDEPRLRTESTILI